MLKIDRSGYEHFFALFCMFTLKKNERKAKPFQSDTWNSEETDVGRVNWCDNTSLDTGMAMNTITDLDNLVLDASPNQQPVHSHKWWDMFSCPPCGIQCEQHCFELPGACRAIQGDQ